MEALEDQSVRTTDFTQNYIIGQSTAMCLQLPSNSYLPNFNHSFTNYNETKSQFYLGDGSSYSSNSSLGPIVNLPSGLDLPFKVVFKICSLVQRGYIPRPALDEKFFQSVDPKRFEIERIEFALEKMQRLKDCCYDPTKLVTQEYNRFKQPRKKSSRSMDEGIAYVCRVSVTPIRVYFFGPEANMSNRVLRQFHDDIDCFFRVSFVDEDREKTHSIDLCSCPFFDGDISRMEIYNRILATLENGIVIENAGLRTFYYTQTLDHFNYAPQSYATFQQRYIVNFKYWSGAQSNSPIFAWLGAEAPIDSNPRAIEFLTNNAPGFKALLVYIEHRHYGESIPFGDIEEVLRNDTIHGYFNPAQALADYAQEVSDTCYQTIKQSWSIIDTIASLSNSLSILSRKFNLCQDLNLASELKDYLDGMYCATAQYDSSAQQPVRVVCGGIDGAPKGADILDRIHAGVVAIKGNKPCYTVSAIEGNQSFYPVSAGEDDGWSWQHVSGQEYQPLWASHLCRRTPPSLVVGSTCHIEQPHNTSHPNEKDLKTRGIVSEKSNGSRIRVDGSFGAEPCEDRGVGLGATRVLEIHYVSLLKGGITLSCVIEVVQHLCVVKGSEIRRKELGFGRGAL
nr:probable RNA-dependent RNA polymerase 1 [Ipomoea batatas]